MRSAIPSDRSPIITIALVLLFAYLPITSFLFAIKNDFFYSYFPAKFFITESLKAGEFPLWNPFINYGYPCYGDLSLSYWNASTWLFAAIGYNAYSFTIEILLYLFLAGAGMYKLTGIWIARKEHRLATAIMYMCSGFVTAHLQHFNWINAAGILPFVIYFFWKVLATQDRKYIFATIFSFSYFFTAVHPGHIISAIYLFVGLTLFYVYRNGFNKQVLIRLFFVSFGIILLLAGPLLAIFEVLPYTNRSGQVIADQVLGVTDPGSWISFLLPFASTSDTSFLTNDIALRNCYIGLIPLAVLPLILGKSKTPIVAFWLSAAIFFLFISTSWAGSIYESMPLINSVRLPGEFRLIALLSLILITAIGLEQGNISGQKMAYAFNVISWILMAIILITAAYIISSRDSLIFDENFSAETNLRSKLKNLVYSISFADKVFIQAVAQFVFARQYRKLFTGQRKSALIKLVAFEFILISLLNTPYTGVGQKSVADVQKLIDESPEGIQQPYTRPEYQIVASYPYTDPIISTWGFYSKNPATKEQMPYPLVLDKSSVYFISGEHQKLLDRPFAFLNSTGIILPQQNTYRSFRFSVNLNTYDTLSVKQINFKGWKVRIDGNPASLINETTIIKVPIPAGSHTVDIYFDNKAMTILLWFHLIAMAVLGILLIGHRIRYILP